MSASTPDFLAHRTGDAVAVAVRDLEPGPARGGYLDSESTENVRLTAAVPLGHKVALRAITAGEDVIEYGIRIGVASADITPGGSTRAARSFSGRPASSPAASTSSRSGASTRKPGSGSRASTTTTSR